MFLLRRVPQPAIALGYEGTIRFSNTTRTFVISLLQQMTLVKYTTAMHTGWRWPFKSTRNVSFQSFLWSPPPTTQDQSFFVNKALYILFSIFEDDVIVQTLSVVIPFWYLAPASDICLDRASWESHSSFNKLSASQKNFKALSQK